MQTDNSRLLVVTMTLMLSGLATIAHAATFTVTNAGDDGSGSLRQAIASANGSAGADIIEFAAGVTGTITLASALPQIVDEVSINGPGADVLSVSGDLAYRVFDVASGISVSIAGLTIADGRVTSTTGTNGAGVSNRGSLVLEDCVIARNRAESGLGGGIDNGAGAALEVIGCAIENNTADSGGGINNDGDLIVIESLIRGNGAVSQGGGIDNSSDAVLIGSLVANNAAQFGAGIGNGNLLTVINTTFSGNTADGADSSGGGIDNFNGTVELIHATVAFNSASSGGGIWSNSEFSVKNSLIVNDAGGGNCVVDAGSFQAPGDNLDTDGSCPGFAASSSTGAALGPLDDNGGPTLTHALGTPSVAVNAASDCTQLDGVSLVEFDQRGISRPQGAACDLGAFELIQPDLIFANGFE